LCKQSVPKDAVKAPELAPQDSVSRGLKLKPPKPLMPSVYKFANRSIVYTHSISIL
jgi:hypothetical protein